MISRKMVNQHENMLFPELSLKDDIPVPVNGEPAQNGLSAIKKELPISFSGRGEVRNFLFRQIAKSATGYIFEVTMPGGLIHYEVFQRTKNLRFGCISYPSAKGFGYIAKTYRTIVEAMKRFEAIGEKEFKNTTGGCLMPKSSFEGSPNKKDQPCTMDSK